MPTFRERLQHGWNAFTNNRDPTLTYSYGDQVNWAPHPGKFRPTLTTEKSIVNAIFNRIAVDAASYAIRHVRVDENDEFIDYIDNSYLDKALTINANSDQTSRAFIQDVVYSMFDEGVIAIVPTDTTINPTTSSAFDVMSMRTAKILQWFPDKVKVSVYNEKIGKQEEIVLPKSMVAIIENPFYEIMNSPNSTLKRLVRKLNLLDAVDEQSSSGKLDLIIQLPYTIKSEARREQANQRKKDIEMQLASSKYGIAYTDATEHITQLNRPVDNNLMSQVEYLTNQVYNQLGMTEEIFKGTADEQTQLNYQNKSIEPTLAAICDAMKWKFLSKTARTQGQSIKYFNKPFKLVPVNQIADIADKFTTAEILTPNEIRAIIGLKPNDDPKSDELRNRHLNQQDSEIMEPNTEEEYPEEGYEEPQENDYGNISVEDL